jgi:hypothetical protein
MEKAFQCAEKIQRKTDKFKENFERDKKLQEIFKDVEMNKLKMNKHVREKS